MLLERLRRVCAMNQSLGSVAVWAPERHGGGSPYLCWFSSFHRCFGLARPVEVCLQFEEAPVSSHQVSLFFWVYTAISVEPLGICCCTSATATLVVQVTVLAVSFHWSVGQSAPSASLFAASPIEI